MLEAWVDFFDKGMVQNLVSEVFGIVVTLVFVSWLGGRAVAHALDRAFLRRWGEYRGYVARRLREVDRRLDTGMTCFAADMEKLAGKPTGQVITADLDEYRRNYDLVLADLDYLTNFMPRHHFALTDRDIGPVSDYIDFIANDVDTIFDRDLSFRNFESMLATHFQGVHTLEMRALDRPDLTRHDLMRRSAADAARTIAAIDRGLWAVRRDAVLAALARTGPRR
ncbi:hypothetical protein [Amaricoccus sp.]|uniref:hypothetical protein n=1 Tax=Amaricoccus sp. TaxID=1872485 RepID=UPI001B65D1DA|nr:hypothetical protein [Amaricoccus sp.]MBP7243308.1 hypothetical protein [Amaricoccus sp.]